MNTYLIGTCKRGAKRITALPKSIVEATDLYAALREARKRFKHDNGKAVWAQFVPKEYVA